MDGRDMEQRIIKMAALGRRFQIGDLYDYRSDRILNSGGVLQFANLALAIQADAEFQLELVCPDAISKWEQMSLDTHLQASTLVGFIDKFRGASNFLTDRTIPTQATRNFICRAKSKKESLPSHFISDVVRLLFNGEIKNTQISEATHVVVGVIYGAEAYCVLSQDLDESDQDDREDAEKKLFNITAKMKTSLESNQDVSDFKEQFDNEEKQLSRLIKCCVYSDLRIQPVRECKVVDAYKHCYKLVEEIQKTDGKNKAVVLAVLLCPLKNCVDKDEKLFRNVDSALIKRCCDIWEQLGSACALAEDIRTSNKITNRASLRQFEETIVKYQQLLKASWKTDIGKARQNIVHEKEVERVAKFAETHPIFRHSRLERWLRYKKAEVEVAEKMSNLKGISLASQNQLKKELADSFEKKYALVLSIPPLDERTNEILFQMADNVNNYASSCHKLVANEELLNEENNSDEESRLPWHMVQHKRKQVLAKIRELVDHVEKNKNFKDQVRFFITPRENGKGYWCRYSVYEAEILIQDNLAKLPISPTNIRIHSAHKAAKKSIRIEWDYCDLGNYPCCFLVEYRKKHSSEFWTEQKTMKPGIHEITISLKTESVFELRVAADTCIGRSEFSDIIDIDSDNLKRPNPKQIPTEEQSVAIVYDSSSSSQQSSEIQLEIERNHDLWNWVVKESGVLANMSSLSPLETALRQFCTLLESLGNQIDQLYTKEKVSENIKLISNLLDDVTDWLIHRRREAEKISSLLKGSHLPVFDLAEIEARKPLAYEKYAKIFILKVNYIQDPLIDRICQLSRHPEPPFKLPVFPFITYEEKRLEFIAKTLYTFSAIESIANRLDSNQKDTTYQIGLIPVSSMLNDGTITTMNYSERAEDVKPTIKSLRRAHSVNSIRINSPDSKKNLRKVVQSRLLLEMSLKDIRPELEVCFVEIENMELFRRAIVKTTRNCSVQKSEMRFVKVDCADEFVAYNCCRCEKTCKEPVKIKYMNLDKLGDGEKLCTSKLCRCPEKEHVFQQFEWRHQTVKITTTLADMKKEFETNRQLTTTEDLLAYCAEELEKMKVKVLNLLEQVSVLSPESTASVDYLIQLLKSEVIRKQQPDYLVRLVTLSNLQAGDSSKTKSIRSGSCGSRRPLLKCHSSFDERVSGSSMTRSRAD